jgi:hypothetical protein
MGYFTTTTMETQLPISRSPSVIGIDVSKATPELHHVTVYFNLKIACTKIKIAKFAFFIST